VALLVAAMSLALGASGTVVGRMRTDGALGGTLPGYSRERTRRQGYLEARVFSQGALVLGAFPLVAGAAVLLMASARRTPLGKARARQVLATPNIAFAVALIAAGAAAWGARAPIPDPDVEFDLAPVE
jgi:hypothetical protein